LADTGNGGPLGSVARFFRRPEPPPMPFFRAVLIGLVFASAGLPSPVWAGKVNTPECQRDLLVANSDVQTSQVRIAAKAAASTKELCPLWREHAGIARKAGAIYQRCLTGTDQRVRTADMASMAADFDQAIASSCT
jgi:hypothetical protein